MVKIPMNLQNLKRIFKRFNGDLDLSPLRGYIVRVILDDIKLFRLIIFESG